MPIVSILTTVYNREKYIGACIESVIASTFEDWEMIIVDDQSKDNSVIIAKTYEAKDSRIKVYVNETNLGDYPNRNKAASYATGKYIKYLDADDMIYPHGLEIMIENMDAFPEASLGISQAVAEDYLPYPFLMQPHESFRREYLTRGVLSVAPTETIIRNDKFKELGMFTGTRFIGDTEMWYKMALHNPVLKMVPGLTFWRRHGDQEFTKGMDSNFYLENDYKHAIKTLKDPLMPLSKNDITMAKQKIDHRFGRDILRLMFDKKEWKKARQIMESCNYSWSQLLKSI